MKTLQELAKEFKQGPFTFPGMYQLNLIMGDGGVICFDCWKSNYNLIGEALRENDIHSSWYPSSVYVYWEGPSITCDNCEKELLSEYGDPQCTSSI